MEARVQRDDGAGPVWYPQSLLTPLAPPALAAEKAGESEQQEEQAEDDQNQEQDNLEICLAVTERVQNGLECADRFCGRFALLNSKKVPKLRELAKNLQDIPHSLYSFILSLVHYRTVPLAHLDLSERVLFPHCLNSLLEYRKQAIPGCVSLLRSFRGHSKVI